MFNDWALAWIGSLWQRWLVRLRHSYSLAPNAKRVGGLLLRPAPVELQELGSEEVSAPGHGELDRVSRASASFNDGARL